MSVKGRTFRGVILSGRGALSSSCNMQGWAFTLSSPSIELLNGFGENGIVTGLLFYHGVVRSPLQSPPRSFLFKVCGTSFGKFFVSGGGDVS